MTGAAALRSGKPRGHGREIVPLPSAMTRLGTKPGYSQPYSPSELTRPPVAGCPSLVGMTTTRRFARLRDRMIDNAVVLRGVAGRHLAHRW